VQPAGWAGCRGALGRWAPASPPGKVLVQLQKRLLRGEPFPRQDGCGWETLAGGGKWRRTCPEKVALPGRGVSLPPRSCGSRTVTPHGAGTSRDSSGGARSDGAVGRQDFSTFLSEPPLTVTGTAGASKAVPQAGRKLPWLGFQGSGGGSYESCGNHTTIRGKRKVMITSRYQLRALPGAGLVNKSSLEKHRCERQRAMHRFPAGRNSRGAGSSQSRRGCKRAEPGHRAPRSLPGSRVSVGWALEERDE